MADNQNKGGLFLAQESRLPSTLPVGCAALIRECVEVLRVRHTEDGKLLTQLADLLEAAEAEQEESERGRQIKSRLIELTAERS
jgi:hypothetical protein